MSKRRHSGKRETLTSIAIVAVLGIVAAGVFAAQFHFNPAVGVAVGETTAAVDAPSGPVTLLAALPPGMVPAGPVEVFDRGNLSDKIDGKAELYLSAGFVALRCQRVGLEPPSEVWLELFAYDMGGERGAFSVFSQQRREGAETSEVTRNAYGTENALCFAHGRHYVEIIASAVTPGITAALTALGRGFVAENEGGGGGGLSGEISLLPQGGMVPGSVELLAADAFGFEDLDQTYIARYRRDEREVTLFLSARPSAESARDLADGYRLFLLEYGGTDVEGGDASQGTHVVDLDGSFEGVFSEGRFLGGVREADSAETARAWLEVLRGRMREAGQ